MGNKERTAAKAAESAKRREKFGLYTVAVKVGGKWEVTEVTEDILQKVLTDRAASEEYHVNPFYIENKSKRLQLVLQPSLYERVKAKAEALGISVNEFCHQTLYKATREE